MSGPTLAEATDRFLSVIEKHQSLQELQEGATGLHAQLPGATKEELDAALQQLLLAVETAQTVPAGSVVLTCGAMVEFGGDPEICGAAILNRLAAVLRGVGGFLEEVDRRAEVQPDEHPDRNQLINQHINDILESNPELAWAYIAQQPTTLGAIAHLSRSTQLRALARSRPELLQLSVGQDNHNGQTSFLTALLRVLDDERLIVLHPAEQKGFEVRISGIADNFQLHMLLMGSLIGDPQEGWLTGQKPDPALIAVARDAAALPERKAMTGAFNLWNWPALQRDGTLPDGTANGNWWIWNEGTPDEIRVFENVRVVLLGPPPYPRHWNVERRFPRMPGELEVQHVLPPDVVRDWLARIAATPRPAEPVA